MGRLSDAEADCDEDGGFEPLQCRRISDGRLYRCRCVNRNGTVISGPEDVDSLRAAPDCGDIGEVQG